MKSTDLRPGIAIRYEGNMFVITQFQHVTPGNLRAFVQVKLKRIPDGALFDKRLRSGEEVEQISMDRREAEYLYSDSSGHIFMDSETYDQYTLSVDMLEDQILYMKPNTMSTVLFADGKPVLLELPKVVDLAVTDTTPAIKGATATNQLKEATLETGLKTRVPPFIEIGEVIRVSTENAAYQSRA